MGFYPRPFGWVKITHTRRGGWRLALGPRILRRWYGRGGGGWSTGAGPFSRYFPAERRARGKR